MNMTLAERIKEYRARLHMTQVELAKQLHVSHAAVSKWETGTTCPDLKLLPILARTLHTDVNTLLDFTSELSDEEIVLFLNKVSERSLKHYDQAHEMVKEKLREYPHCDQLRYGCAVVLYGGLMRKEVHGYEQYREELLSWMKAVSESFDLKLRYGAKQFLIGVYRNEKRFDQAEALLEELPSLSEIDPERMKITLEKEKGNLKEAEALCENMILRNVNRLFTELELLLELRCELKEMKQASHLANCMAQFAQTIDLCEYHAYMGYFLVAMYSKDVKKICSTFQQLLTACEKSWKIKDSLIYPHVKTKSISEEFSDMLKAELLQGIMEEECGSILKSDPEFIKICQDHDLVLP